MDAPSTSSGKGPWNSKAANELSGMDRNQDGDNKLPEQQALIQRHSKNESASAGETQNLMSNKTVDHAMKPSLASDQPSSDIQFEDFLERYRNSMEKLVDFVQQEEQTPSEEFGLLSTSGWRDIAYRLATVRKGCKIPSAETTRAAGVWNVLVYKKQHLAFFRHAKAGSTSLLSYLLLLNNIDPEPLNQIELHKTSFRFRLKNKSHIENSFTFTAVRHPFQRLTSLYCNKRVMENFNVIQDNIRNMTSEEREKELLKYRYKVELGVEEPAVMVGTWIRRAISDHFLPEDRRNDGSLLAHYQNASIPHQRFYSEGSADQTSSNLSGPESFRTFVHEVVLQLLKCQNDPKCIAHTDIHMMPQVLRWSPCVFHLDMIMKVETLDRDIKLMAELLGLPDLWKNKEGTQTGWPEKTSEELTDGEIERHLRKKREVDQNDARKTEKRSEEFTSGEIERLLRKKREVDQNDVWETERRSEELTSGEIERHLRKKREVDQNDAWETERRSEELTSEEIERHLRKKREVDQNDVWETEKRSDQEAPNYEGDLKKLNDAKNNRGSLEEKAMMTTPEHWKKSDSETGFFQRNTSGEKCASYEEYMKQLSQRDIDLIYTAYYWDFKLFGYDPFE